MLHLDVQHLSSSLTVQPGDEFWPTEAALCKLHSRLHSAAQVSQGFTHQKLGTSLSVQQADVGPPWSFPKCDNVVECKRTQGQVQWSIYIHGQLS